MSEVALFDEIDRPEAEPFVAETPEPAAEAAPASETLPAAATIDPALVEAAAPAAPVAPVPAKEPERIPLATLLEERSQSEKRIRALEDKLAKAVPEKPEPAVAEIDYTQDPKGYMDARVQKALHQLEQFKKEGTEALEQVSARTNDLQLAQAITNAEAQVAIDTPDYQQALMHVRNVRFQQLQLINPEATADQLTQHLAQEERAMAAAELARGRNPYALLYQVAKTFGYTPPAAKPAAPSAPSASGKANGGTPTLSPELTLGKTGGSAPDTAPAEEDEGEDILAAAFSERFGRKRA